MTNYNISTDEIIPKDSNRYNPDALQIDDTTGRAILIPEKPLGSYGLEDIIAYNGMLGAIPQEVRSQVPSLDSAIRTAERSFNNIYLYQLVREIRDELASGVPEEEVATKIRFSDFCSHGKELQEAGISGELIKEKLRVRLDINLEESRKLEYGGIREFHQSLDRAIMSVGVLDENWNRASRYSIMADSASRMFEQEYTQEEIEEQLGKLYVGIVSRLRNSVRSVNIGGIEGYLGQKIDIAELLPCLRVLIDEGATVSQCTEKLISDSVVGASRLLDTKHPYGLYLKYLQDIGIDVPRVVEVIAKRMGAPSRNPNDEWAQEQIKKDNAQLSQFGLRFQIGKHGSLQVLRLPADTNGVIE